MLCILMNEDDERDMKTPSWQRVWYVGQASLIALNGMFSRGKRRVGVTPCLLVGDVEGYLVDCVFGYVDEEEGCHVRDDEGSDTSCCVFYVGQNRSVADGKVRYGLVVIHSR